MKPILLSGTEVYFSGEHVREISVTTDDKSIIIYMISRKVLLAKNIIIE